MTNPSSANSPPSALKNVLKSARRTAGVLVAAIVAIFTMGCAVTGSGDVIEKTQQVSRYDEIALGDGFEGRVTYGTDYGVRLRADDNLMDDVRVEVLGGRLTVDLDGLNTHKATLEVEFTVPLLERIHVSDGGTIDSREVALSRDFELELTGGSVAHIARPLTEKHDSMGISSSGGSVFDVSASADQAVIDISGGGTGTLDGYASTMTLELTSGSNLDAWDFDTQQLSFHLSGGSVANARVLDQGAGSLSGGSVLEVSGGGKIDAKKSGGSSVVVD